MNVATSSLGQGSYSTLPPTPLEKLARWLHWPLAAGAIVDVAGASDRSIDEILDM